MYRSYTAADYKKHLGLPDDYRVDGFFTYGTWNRTKQTAILNQVIGRMDKKVETCELTSFLSRMVELRIDGKVIWFDVSYGGAMLSEFIHLACLFGSKQNILLGSCGGLSADVTMGDFIVPDWSYGSESSTRMYQKTIVDYKFHSDSTSNQAIIQKLPSSHKFWTGPTMTCQAMMAETWEDVQEWSDAGYLGVEMEAATVFAVSNHFGVPSSALLMMTDNLIKEETVFSENYQEFNTKIRDTLLKLQYRIALEVLLEEA